MTAVPTDVVVVDHLVLLEDLVKDDAAIRGLVLVRSEADKQVVDFLIDRRVVEKLRRTLLGLRIAGAQDSKRTKEIELPSEGFGEPFDP